MRAFYASDEAGHRSGLMRDLEGEVGELGTGWATGDGEAGSDGKSSEVESALVIGKAKADRMNRVGVGARARGRDGEGGAEVVEEPAEVAVAGCLARVDRVSRGVPLFGSNYRYTSINWICQAAKSRRQSRSPELRTFSSSRSGLPQPPVMRPARFSPR